MSKKFSAVRRDLHQEVTQAIIAALEKGTAPWIRPWDKGAAESFPVNASTGVPYRGINVLLLWAEAHTKGYALDRWLTYKQAQAVGGQVRKGEHGVTCVKYRLLEKTKTAADGSESVEKIPMLNSFTLFNVAQIDGLPAEMTEGGTPVRDIEPLVALDEFLAAQQVVEVAGRGRAYYSPGADHVGMPPRDTFVDDAAYYSTRAHEYVHWTGHASRCNRSQTGAFGSPEYAFEELVAEMGSAFICAEFGVAGQLQHQEYIGEWIKTLQNDKHALFRAARLSRQAVELMHKNAGTGVNLPSESEEEQEPERLAA